MAEGRDSTDSGNRWSSDTKLDDSMPSMSSLSRSSDSVEAIVCGNHKQEVTYFCKTHMEELCFTCKCKKHGSCNTVIDITRAAKEIYSKSHGQKIIQSLKELSDRFNDCKTATEELKHNLQENRRIACDTLKQIRKLIDEYLDQLEEESRAEIDRVCKEKTKALDERIQICNASFSSLTAFLSRIYRSMSLRNKEEIFIHINTASTETKQYCRMLFDLNRELPDIDLKFVQNDAISKLKNILSDLGKLAVDCSPLSRADAAMEPVYIGEIKLRPALTSGMESSEKDISEKWLSNITSFEVLPDGRKLVLDSQNKKLQLYDQNNIFLTERDLSVATLSVSLCGSTDAIVTTGSNKLLRVKITDDLKVSEFTTSSNIFSMTGYCKGFVACLWNEKEKQWEISVMDRDLNISKTIIKDKGTRFKSPDYLAVIADEKMVYILDTRKGCYGITMAGEVLFRYQDPRAVVYCGLAVGSDGLFIGVRSASRTPVQKLGFHGQRAVCTAFEKGHPIKIQDNQLVLFTCGEKDEKHQVMLRFYFIWK